MMICTAGSLLCIFYYVALVIHNRFWQLDFSIIWLFLGIILAVVTGLLRYEAIHGSIIPGWIKTVIGIACGVFLIMVVILGGLVVRGMYTEPVKNLDYVIILGAHVRGEVPSKALKKRMDKAYEYAVENPETILILAGGQGAGESISEAECMRRYLTEKGLDEKRMVMEERSTTTRENLIFSDQLTGCGKMNTALISNDFHIFRATYIAESLGFEHTTGLAAPTDRIALPNYILRETLALIKAGITKNTSL